jgi:transcriptional regulator with XRE-family HTH domain
VFVMVPPVPLHQLIGARLRQLREAAGLRQEDIATQARVLGFDWVRGTVAMIEGGHRRVTLEEFLALPLLLSYVGIPDISLSRLIPTDTPAQLNAQAAVSADTAHRFLTGKSAGEQDTQKGGPAVTEGRDEWDEAIALWRRWATGRSRRPRGPDPAAISAAIVDSRGDALANAARVLDVSPVAVSLAALLTWGRLLTAERDDRVRQRVGASAPDARTLQAVRGHVTRTLLEELRAVLQDLSKTTRRKR